MTKLLTQQKFNFEGNMQNAGCFSCFEPYYNVKIQTNIDKILYFPDEKVNLEMIIDNRESQRRI